MAVIRAAPDLHEADTALQESARQQAVAAEVLRNRIIEAIELSRRRRFSLDLQDFGRAQLESRRQFVGGDPRIEPGIPVARSLVGAVQLVEENQTVGFTRPSDIAVSGREQVKDW